MGLNQIEKQLLGLTRPRMHLAMLFHSWVSLRMFIGIVTVSLMSYSLKLKKKGKKKRFFFPFDIFSVFFDISISFL